MGARRTLRGGRDFTRVFRGGRRGRRDGITAYVAPSTDPGTARLGLSVRSSVGSAVERNRAKRRLRAVWRTLDLSQDLDVVIQVDRGAMGLPYQELEKHVKGAVAAAGGIS